MQEHLHGQDKQVLMDLNLKSSLYYYYNKALLLLLVLCLLSVENAICWSPTISKNLHLEIT